MYSTVLFDLDGTLSDPLDGIARSINYALVEYGFEAQPQSELASCVGPPLDQSFAALIGRDDPDLILSLVTKYRERYLDVGYAENTLYPSVLDTLCALEAANVRMALCTSKPEPGTRLILKRFELNGFFRFISCGDLGVEKWQQLAELRQNNTVDEHAIMIGDRAVDIEAGQRNGLSSGAVTWGFGSELELKSAKPTRWFHQPSDWLMLLNSDSTAS